MKKKAMIVAMSMLAALPLSSCKDGRGKETEYLPPEVERYENHIEIDGQWGASAATGADGQYGIGDPFVMRFNGKYYLYPSTSDPCDGIKVFESDDLVHWTYRGLAVAENEKTAHGAYAPEVVYYNGYFYLCQARAGRGHYIYRSESPTEGFRLVSSTEGVGKDDIDYGNLGMGIDGSFYVSDDGRLYLLHTSTPSGLKYNELTDSEKLTAATVGATGNLSDSSLNGWIEGPGIFRRGAFSYLTYTGNHVISRGYRVGYSYAENLQDLDSFIQPEDNVTIIDTDQEHYGLGHSSNTVGPDLDSIYTAYHSYVGRGPARRYNVDRYFASGSVLTANGVTHRPVAMPDRADCSGYADRLTLSGGVYSIGNCNGYFTAEYNFVPDEGQELLFGDGYRIVFKDGKILLTNGKGAKDAPLGEAEMRLPEGRLACVRVENGDGVGYVYVNGMRKITYAAQKTAGAVGYTEADGVGFTAVTNEVFGTSDFEALKNFPLKFPAITYLKGENRGFSLRGAKRLAGGARVGEKEKTVRVGDAYAVSLGKGDWVKYAIDVPADASYAIAAELAAASAGTRIKVSVGESSFTATVPALGGETVRVYLGELAAKAGVGTMKAEVLSGAAQIVLFDVNGCDGGGDVSLNGYDVLNGVAEETADGLRVSGGDGAVLFRGTNVANFEAEMEFSCAAAIDTNFGVMVRASHYSYYPAQPAQSWRGYYVQLGMSMISLKRYDYGDTGSLSSTRTGAIDLTQNARHTLKIRAEGTKISVTLDGTLAFSGTDSCAFYAGGLGVFAGRGEITVHGLKYTKLREG